MKKIVFVLIFSLVFTCIPFSAEAKTTTKYTTKTVALKEKIGNNKKTIAKVKAKTKLIVIKKYKNWSLVEYKDQTAYVRNLYLHSKKPYNKYKGRRFKKVGRGRWNGCSWTWYTTKRFPDRKNYLGIKGKHVDKRGFVCDKDGYICLASGRGNKKKHAIVPTPFGKYGKVYDTNGGYNNRWFDVYTTW